MTLSEEQVQQILLVIQGLWHGISGADNQFGLFKTIRESKSAADFLTDSRAQFAGNGVIEQLVSGLTPGGGDDLDAAEQDAAAKLSFEPDALMDQVSAMNAMLGSSPDAHDVRVFIYQLMHTIAAAAGTGRFGGGDKISANEQQWLDVLRQRLGI